MRSVYFTLTALLVLAFTVAIAPAQVVTGTVYGTVLDPSGAAVVGAQVEAVNEGTGATTVVATNELGEFTLTSLQRGTYTITTTAQGFKPQRLTGFVVSAGQRLRTTYQLELGDITETVEVSAEAPLINTATAEQRSDLTSTQVQELPLVRRDWTNLLAVNTGMSTAGTGGVTMNGLPPSGFRLTVDGIDSEGDPELPSLSMYQGPNYIKGISTEAIQEINVAKGIASAEIANTMSGNVNLTTKGGTNEFHGSLFELNQTENANARNQFLTTKSPVVFNQFGGSLGGPIVRDKLFFFGVYEGYRERAFAALSGDTPTANFRAQAIAAVPAYKDYLDLFPLPNQPHDPDEVTGSFIGAGSAARNDNHALGRVDWNISASTIANFRYTRGRPDRLQPRVTALNPRTFGGFHESGSLQVTHFRSTWTSETRYGINLNDVTRLDGIFDLGIACTGGLGFGSCGETLFKGGYTQTWEEIVGTTRGKHSIKFGGMYLTRRDQRENIEVPDIRYASVQDYFDNIPNRVQVTFGVKNFQIRNHALGFFFQDDIKVNRNLTLNLGVRWDYFAVPDERDERMFNRGGPFGLGELLPPDEIYEADWNNFSPRVGFAYSPGEESKTVFRGGIGVFHNPHTLFGGPVETIKNAVDEPSRVVFGRADVLSGQFGDAIRYPVFNDEVLPLIKGPGGVESGTAVNPEFPHPYSVQWTFGIQRQLGSDWALDTAYVGNHGVKLNMVRFINQPDRVTGARPFAGFGQFRFYDTSESATYNSWQTSLKKRFSEDLGVGFYYTWARSLSHTNDADLLLPTSPQDIFNVAADRGPTPFDINHTFKSDFTYELPIARLSSGSRAQELLLAGWSVSGIFTAETGQPLWVTDGGAGLQGARPDYIGGEPTFDNSHDTLVRINRDALARVPNGAESGVAIRPGTLGRNALRHEGLWDIDLSLAKNLYLTEKYRLQFRADLLNAFNHTNFSAPSTDITSGSFGIFRSSRGARVVQFYLRLTF